MNDNTDAASTADIQQAPAPKAEPAKSELKSIDTGVYSALKAQADTAPQPKAAKPEAKTPDPHATPADKGADAGSSEAEHQDEERKLEPWMRKRLSRAEEKGRKQARDEVLAEIRAQRAPEPSKSDDTSKPANTPKTLADFDYDVGKYTQYEIREGVKSALAERDAENDRRAAEQKATEARTVFEKRRAEFEKRVGEGAWEEMVSANVDVPQEVIDLLTGHEKDLDIAHYLVNHPDELDKIRGKSKLEIARGLTAIESRLSGSHDEALPPKTTKAPPPPPIISGAGKSVKSITDMSTDERIAEWKRQKQARRQSA